MEALRARARDRRKELSRGMTSGQQETQANMLSSAGGESDVQDESLSTGDRFPVDGLR